MCLRRNDVFLLGAYLGSVLLGVTIFITGAYDACGGLFWWCVAWVVWMFPLVFGLEYDSVQHQQFPWGLKVGLKVAAVCLELVGAILEIDVLPQLVTHSEDGSRNSCASFYESYDARSLGLLVVARIIFWSVLAVFILDYTLRDCICVPRRSLSQSEEVV